MAGASRRRQVGWVRGAVAIIAALALGGCHSVRLAPDYDAQIDAGVTAILGDATAFVQKMNEAAGTPAGDYDHNRDFYATEHGRIVALEARAEATRVLGACPTTAAAAAVARGFHASDQVVAALQQTPADDCLATELGLLDGALSDLKAFHVAQGPRGIPAVASGPILEGGLGSIARTIIYIETRARAGGSGAKPNGA